LAAVISLEGLLILILAVSGWILRERAQALHSENAQLETRLQAASPPGPGLQVAREMMLVRLQRIDWTPKLAAISEDIPPGLRLDQITGQFGIKGAPRLELKGHVRAGAADMPSVSRIMEAFGRDRRISESFPETKLQTLEAGEGGRFLIACEAAWKDS
jgi:hypothetical protein